MRGLGPAYLAPIDMRPYKGLCNVNDQLPAKCKQYELVSVQHLVSGTHPSSCVWLLFLEPLYVTHDVFHHYLQHSQQV